MARQPRLVLPDHAHYVIQRGHSGQPVFTDAEDRRSFLEALREAAATHRVAVHAVALPDTEAQLLLTPPSADALSRTMQALGRRYVSAHNQRHGRSGTLWDGRFRCAVVEPGAPALALLCLIDALGAATGSPSHRLGARLDALLTDPPEFWQLGNTPFDREAAYRRRLAEGTAPAQAEAWRQAALGGWAIGAPAFLQQLARQAARAVQPRPRGRPPSPKA
jgi:putative transposase